MVATDLQALREVLGEVLELGERISALEEDSALLGALPEFDSLAVIALITAIQERFGIAIQDEDIEPEIFDTVGSLLRFIQTRGRRGSPFEA